MKPNNFPLRPNLNGSEELYTQTNDIPQKFTLDTTKEFITAPTDITYSELYNKIINEELVAGSWYRLTDYTSVNFLNGWEIANNNPTPSDPNFNPQEIYEGEVEVLLLQAISPYQISEIGYSETFQGDIVQYQPYTNKIGVDIGGIYNGQTLPDASTVSGFDLQWDGTNVYFDMPTGYPALYGHYFYLYCEFNDGVDSYYQDGTFEPLMSNGHCQYPYTSDEVYYGYPKAMTRIKLEEGGTKVVLLDLVEADYTNYVADTLYVDHIYEIGNAYGWITKRIDTQRNITAPLDFRGRKYRRFEVDLSAVNATLGTGYYGIGDNFKGQGTTGNYQDFKVFGNYGYEAYNIEWNDMGGADSSWYAGYNDNNVFLGSINDVKIESDFRSNTMGGEGFENNVIGRSFNYNVIIDFYRNTIGSYFSENTIGSNSNHNIIGNEVNSNNIGFNFYNNNIGNTFQSNTIGNDFYRNTIGNSFYQNTIGNDFQDNTIGNSFNSNTIVNDFRWNTTKYSVASTDFSLATHVYALYNCEIFGRSDSTLQLSYIDGTNTIQYAAITA